MSGRWDEAAQRAAEVTPIFPDRSEAMPSQPDATRLNERDVIDAVVRQFIDTMLAHQGDSIASAKGTVKDGDFSTPSATREVVLSTGLMLIHTFQRYVTWNFYVGKDRFGLDVFFVVRSDCTWEFSIIGYHDEAGRIERCIYGYERLYYGSSPYRFKGPETDDPLYDLGRAQPAMAAFLTMCGYPLPS